MVFGIVSSLAGLIKVRYLTDKAIIDNCISRLHYKFTAAIFFGACLLCTATTFIGNPIECLTEEKLLTVVNSYCWIASKFTLPDKYRYSTPGKHVAHPGVGLSVVGEEKVVEHNYYQWVPFMLLFQGVIFYAPHWFWKNWEDGKVGKISDGLRGTIAESKEERKARQTRLVEYIVDSMSLHNWYASGFFFSEVFNFINPIANIYMIDSFLGGKFLSYGLNAIQKTGNISAYEEVFPRVVKCTFHYFGPSGDIQRMHPICVLPLNIINDKIYLCLWWWLIILSILSGLAVMYSSAIILSTHVRRMVLFRRFKYRVSEGCQNIVNHTRAGDFLLLHLLGQNINMTIFEEVLEELNIKLQGYEPNAPSNVATMERMPIYPKKDSYLPQ